jgi:hypothetical protein
MLFVRLLISISSLIAKKIPFRAIAFLRRFCHTCLESIRFSLLWISQQYFFYKEISSALCPTPNLEDEVSMFMSLSDSVAQLYPQAPVSPFVPLSGSQGYGGGIRTRLHTGVYYYIYISAVNGASHLSHRITSTSHNCTCRCVI